MLSMAISVVAQELGSENSLRAQTLRSQKARSQPGKDAGGRLVWKLLNRFMKPPIVHYTNISLRNYF